MNFSGIIDKLKQYPIAVISVILLVAFLVAIFIRGNVTTDLEVKEADLNSRIRTIEENSKNSNNLQQDTEAIAVVVEKMQSLLFDRNERAININFFYDFEDKAEVVISNISQLPQSDPLYDSAGPRKLDLHSTLIFNITLSGSFTEILKFMYELHRVDPLIRVADFQVSREGGELGAGNVDARLRVLVMAKKN